MKLSQSLFLAVSTTLLAGIATASAHIGLGGRLFNVSNPIDGAVFSINTQTVSSSFGWADATDADWGDSHRTRAYKFTLASTQTVTITAQRLNILGQSGAADTFLPAFSLFTKPGAFVASTHDTSPATSAYLLTTGSPIKEGAFTALSPWKIHNDANTELSFETLVGHAADGTAANFGSAPGINGDGNADGLVSATFSGLLAGDYYLFVGGANYGAQSLENPTYPTYGVGVTVAAPEPTSAALLALGIAGLGLLRRRQADAL